ncbi:MAG: nucleotide pyrophosphohydrolase [SAR202 cluster bacterium]|nr:nucleotide pyrophosphohydrolase [SAR202 cluster bacterium]
MDETTTVSVLKQLVADFVDERNWDRYHTPKNLAMAISVEAADLMELFRWYTPEECEDRMAELKTRQAATEEIADVMILCMSFANRNGIDLSETISAKVKKNARKYPVGQGGV